MTVEKTADLAVGLKHTETLLVEERHTVPAVGADWPGFSTMPPVFATAKMVAFAEETCIRALKGHLGHGQKTVGIHIDMSHTAATPVGMTVETTIELVEIDRRKLTFKIASRDEHDLIGEGIHQRAIVDSASFIEKMNEKQGRRA